MTHPDFIHRFVPATDAGAVPILALHGTGGNEHDLVPLIEQLSPGSAILSPRGPVSEHGMPRFFRRLAEGIFDEADVVRRAGDLARFIEDAQARYGIAPPMAVGYSNGANIAAAVMLLHPGVLAGAVLFRAMQPLKSTPPAALPGTPILILSGAADPIVPASDVAGLAERLKANGGAVEHVTLPAGHPLTRADLDFAGDWLRARAARPPLPTAAA